MSKAEGKLLVLK